MKIDIKNKTLTQGIFKKTNYYEVILTVELSEEEKAIIKERQLENRIIMERPFPATSSLDGPYNLTFDKLLDGVDNFNLLTLSEAKEYQELLIKRLKIAKEFLNDNSTQAEDASIEI